jgi:uncharacterized membrane protein YeaQ/YmgE (transglycosylase-associated protein family)
VTLTHLLVLLLVGALAGLIGERLVSRAMPGGLIGAIVAGLVGAWLMVDVLHVVLAPELSLAGIPVLSAILGAAVVVLLFSLVAGGAAFGRRGWRT